MNLKKDSTRNWSELIWLRVTAEGGK
jgi:hypothetical protein